MELRHLRYFLAVAEEGQFTSAAERLAIQQPPLSRQIQALEDEVGFRLFVRLPRGVVLTPAGEAFAQDARHVFATLQTSVERSRRIARGEVGQVMIGLTSSASFHPVTTDAIREFRRLHPDVGVDLIELNAAEVNEQLLSGRVDVAFLRKPVESPAELAFALLDEEAMVAVLPQGHALLARERGKPMAVTLASLASDPWILIRRPGAQGMYADLLTACRTAGFSPNVAKEVPRMLSGIQLVAAGMGVTFVPASMQRYSQAGAVYRPLKTASQVTAPLTLCWRTTHHNDAAEGFVRFVIAFHARHGG